MCDLVLNMDEVAPVMANLAAGGTDITALHNHLLRNQPFTIYMHVLGHSIRSSPLRNLQEPGRSGQPEPAAIAWS
jgi:Domain of Unknown Function (DUF1259)